MKVMHDGGKEFTSTDFRNFLILNGIKDKQIPKGYPQEQGKVEAYNKIVIAEFLQVEELIDEKDGAKKYQSFVNSYNYEREHGGINGMTPAEKFMKCLKPRYTKTRQKVSAMLVHHFVNHVWKYNTYLSWHRQSSLRMCCLDTYESPWSQSKLIIRWIMKISSIITSKLYAAYSLSMSFRTFHFPKINGSLSL
jgi:Integrase core domain